MPVWPPGRSFSQSSFLAQRWITVFEPRGFAVTQWPCTLTSKPNCRLYHSAALVASFTSTATEPTSVNMMENWAEVDISMRVRSPPPPPTHLSGADGALVIRRFRRLVATAKNSGRPSGQGRNSHGDVVRIEHDLVSLRYTGGIRHDTHRPCRSNSSLTSKRFPAPGARTWLLVPSAHGLEPSIRNREGDPYRF